MKWLSVHKAKTINLYNVISNFLGQAEHHSKLGTHTLCHLIFYNVAYGSFTVRMIILYPVLMSHYRFCT